MNNISVTGRAVRDVELRYTSSGKPVSSGTIAVQRKYKTNNEYESDFLDFVCWGRGGELMAEHIKKGDSFGISGSLTTRTYENNEGRNIKVTEINVAEFDFPVRPKNGQNSNGNSNQGNYSSNQSNRTQQSRREPQDPFDNDPFSGHSQPLDDDEFGGLPF